jgi:hypothetical protein
MVAGFFVFVTLLIRGCFGLIWLALLHVESLPSLPEDLADLSWIMQAESGNCNGKPADRKSSRLGEGGGGGVNYQR